MRKNAEAAVLASFAADALALGVHWIYDAKKIEKEHGRVEQFLKPGINSYHPGKQKGDFTHYGDQTLVLLESVAYVDGFDPADFFIRWRGLFDNYSGYVDQATKGTLNNIAAGKSVHDAASGSNDLAGASRIGALVLSCRDDLDSLVAAAKTQTGMTHGDSLTVDTAEFFARVVFKVLRNTAPSDAIRETAEGHFAGTVLGEWCDRGLESIAEESIPAIIGFGLSCHTPDAFPGVIHLIARYENDFKEALVQSVMAGGDNAARAMMVAMVLGAWHGVEKIPEEWINGLNKRDVIHGLIARID